MLERGDPAIWAAFQSLPDESGEGSGALDPKVDWVGSANPRALSYLRSAPNLAYFVGTTPTDAKTGLALAEGVVIVVDGDDGEHRRDASGPLVPKDGRRGRRPRSNAPTSSGSWRAYS